MSSGAIDDRLGSNSLLLELQERYPELKSYLSTCDSLPILRTCVPYGGGISKDLQVRFLDRRLNVVLDGIDISLAPARHESTEGALRRFCQIGVDYAEDPRGHRLANRAEYEKVAELLYNKAEYEEVPNPDYPNKSPGGFAFGPVGLEHRLRTSQECWDMYDDFLDPQLLAIERGELSAVDPRLDLYPYRGTELYDKLKRLQNG